MKYLLSSFHKGWMTEYAFSVLFSGLMKPIHVELSNEAVDFLVPEVLG